MDALKQLLEEEEGRVAHAYTDSNGFLTIGVGHLIDPRRGGRIPDWIIDMLLSDDIHTVETSALTLQGYAEEASEIRKAVLSSMIFQLGLAGVRGFPAMLAAFAAGDYQKAAQEGLNSKWARQDSPARARRQMAMMASGTWVPKDGK